MIKLAIAEDHQSLIDGIELLLKDEEGINIVGMANDGEALLEIVHKKQPDVVITDIRMPRIDGIAACRQIKKHNPKIKVLAFSMFDQTDAIRQMLDAGASGYILKRSGLHELLNAINTVASGKTYFDAAINHEKLITNNSNTTKPLLSKSERAILKLIGNGKSSSEIAALRFTSVSTVEKHRKNMMRKLGSSGKGELLRFAIERKYDFDR